MVLEEEATDEAPATLRVNEDTAPVADTVATPSVTADAPIMLTEHSDDVAWKRTSDDEDPDANTALEAKTATEAAAPEIFSMSALPMSVELTTETTKFVAAPLTLMAAKDAVDAPKHVDPLVSSKETPDTEVAAVGAYNRPATFDSLLPCSVMLEVVSVPANSKLRLDVREQDWNDKTTLDAADEAVTHAPEAAANVVEMATKLN